MSNRKKLRKRAVHGSWYGDQARQAMPSAVTPWAQPDPTPEYDDATRQAMLQVVAGLQAWSESLDAHKEHIEAARKVWWGGEDSVPAEMPDWPEGSVGDRFFSGMLLDDAMKAPSLRTAVVPDAHVIAADPAHWNVAVSVLIRAAVLDGMPADDPVASRLLDVLGSVAEDEVAWGEAWADGVGPPEYEPDFPEQDGPVSLLGTCALVDATWALIGEDSLSEVLGVLAAALSDVVPGLDGQAVADVLVAAFAHHYRCEMPGDDEVLERLGTLGSGNPLEDLVTAGLVAPGDCVRVGLAVLSALGELGRSRSASVLHDDRVRALS